MNHFSKPSITNALLITTLTMVGCSKDILKFDEIIDINQQFNAINHLYIDQVIDASKTQIFIKDNIDSIGEIGRAHV